MKTGWLIIILAATVLPVPFLEPSLAPAADWPSWRGPTGDGISPETGVPVRWSADGNIAWKTPISGTGHSSPIVSAGRIFLTSADRSKWTRTLLSLDAKTGEILRRRVVLKAKPEKTHRLNCLEAKTGRVLWREKLGRHHSASPVSAGGNLYFLDDAGVAWVVAAAPAYRLVARNDLGEQCRASPAVAGGRIYIRTARNLYCIGK